MRRKTRKMEIGIGDKVLMKKYGKYSNKVPVDLRPLEVTGNSERQITMKRKEKGYKRNQNKVVLLPNRWKHLQTGKEELDEKVEIESDSDVELNLLENEETVEVPVVMVEMLRERDYPVIVESVEDEDGSYWEVMLDSDNMEGGWIAIGEEERTEVEDVEETEIVNESGEVGGNENVVDQEIGETYNVVEEDMNDCVTVVCKKPGYTHSKKKLK